ncbi:LPXTG cell wall anchor domain-containing protein, partial [Enterococcus faecalis]|uniref:LPXTG cell wall anchor domain-containing protein n=1 Tax=Enterococcus faecalis TaxID=1351 RepID=UPI003D0EC740
NASDTYGNQFPRTGEKTTFSLIAKIVGLMMLLITGVVVFYRKRKGNKTND